MISPISAPRDAVGMCLLGDRLYAVGGYDGQHYLKDVESYDPINNEWSKVGNFRTHFTPIFCCITSVFYPKHFLTLLHCSYF